MHFSTAGLVSALLISLVAGVPADLEDRSPAPVPALTSAPSPKATFGCTHEADPDGAEGYCPAVAATGWCVCSDSSTYAIETGSNPCGYTTTPAAGPTTLASTNCNSTSASTSATATVTPATSRSKCSQKICPKLCDLGSGSAKRSIETFNYNPLTKRFYEFSNPDTFPYDLLKQSYTLNICPTKPSSNTFYWKKFLRGQYAAALQGLCGCATIIVASGNGVFSSHLWENDEANTPPQDLQPANYQATLTDLKNNLSPNKDELSGGQAFLIIPMDPDNTDSYLYGSTIVDAMKQAISDASGITPQVATYIPLDYATSTELGTDRRGTASFEFDPSYEANGQTGKAYRVISEGTVLALKTGL